MRLPHHLLNSQFFQYENVEDLLHALGARVQGAEISEIRRLTALGLPPVTSAETIAAMLGVHPGLIWSFEHKTSRHYRTFDIPKGRGFRRIQAPKIGLKILQKWISVQIAPHINTPHYVYGFVKGRSHVQAAKRHVGAQWAVSFDIKDFFQTTDIGSVMKSLQVVGFSTTTAQMLAHFFCLDEVLSQGSPASPCISNLCFGEVDNRLDVLRSHYDCTLTRYADDIVFSGAGETPKQLIQDVHNCFTGTPWKLSTEKQTIQPVKGRIKIHGLLVDGARLKLTRGYRNKIRAYRHIMNDKTKSIHSAKKLKGHIDYAKHVEQLAAEGELS